MKKKIEDFYGKSQMAKEIYQTMLDKDSTIHMRDVDFIVREVFNIIRKRSVEGLETFITDFGKFSIVAKKGHSYNMGNGYAGTFGTRHRLGFKGSRKMNKEISKAMGDE